MMKNVVKNIGLFAAGGLLGGIVGSVASGGGSDSPPSASPAVTVTAKAPDKTATKAPTQDKTTQAPPSTVSDGTYLVGTDLGAGSYRTDGPGSTDVLDSCYWEIAKDDSADLDSIVANDNLTGPGRLTVRAGQYLKLSGGCEWKRA